MGNRLSKIYTRTGDDGTTGLGDGTRVPKDGPRVEAYGTVDELNSTIGVLLAVPALPDTVISCLTEIQHELFDMGGELCIPGTQAIQAERIVQLGGVAEGTAKVVAQRSQVLDYPLTLTSGAEHVSALSDSLAHFGRTARIGIEELDDLGDKDGADVLTEVSRGIDKWLWFVEAHQQASS